MNTRIRISLLIIWLLDIVARGLTAIALTSQQMTGRIFRLRDRYNQQIDRQWRSIAHRQPRLWCLVGGQVYDDVDKVMAEMKRRHGSVVRVIVDGHVWRYFVGLRLVAEAIPDPDGWEAWERSQEVPRFPVSYFKHRVFFAD